MTFHPNSDTAWTKAKPGEYVMFRHEVDPHGKSLHVEWAVATREERDKLSASWRTWVKKEG